MFQVRSLRYIADGLRHYYVMFQMQSKDDSICILIKYYAFIEGSGRRFMYIRDFQCGGWPAVPRRDSGNKDRVRGSLMRVLMYVYFYSLGTLHKPMGRGPHGATPIHPPHAFIGCMPGVWYTI